MVVGSFLPHRQYTFILTMKRVFQVALSTLLLGLVISYLSYLVTRSNNLTDYFQGTLPNSAFHILKHNIVFLVYFRIPIFGILYYVYSFVMTFIFIGLSISHQGFLFTMMRLKHLPLELLALSIPVTMSFSRKLNLKKELFYSLVATCLLIVAAIIEFHL